MRLEETSVLPSEADKVVFLSRPEVWPHGPDTVEVVETHMSWVFLAGPIVGKLKKPVRTRFLDFSTLARREGAVAEELRLNRRLAPDVYLGARALRLGSQGGLTLHGKGRVVDWLVEMRRLPEDQTLKRLIAAGRVTPADLRPFADRLVAFYHGLAPAGLAPEVYAGRFETEQAETVRVLTDPALAMRAPALDRALEAFEVTYRDVRPLLAARVQARRIVEGHGDLRPEHVFLTDPPVVIDCLEFNRGLRTVDPFDEIAFLGVECALLGAPWVFPALRQRLEAGLDDRPDPRLLVFYWCYRALLRARLALLHLAEPRPRNVGKWRPLTSRYLALAANPGLNTTGQ